MLKSFILLCLCLFSQFHEQLLSQQVYPVKRAEVLEYSNLKELYLQKQQLDNIESALSMIERFLKNDDLSLISTDTLTAKQVKDFIKVFDNPENNLFEIVAINSVTAKKIVFSVNLYLYFERAHLKLYKGSFNIGFELEPKKVVFPLYNTDYTAKNYQNVNFRVNKVLAATFNSNMSKADTYVSKYKAYLTHEYLHFEAPTRKLNYIISDGYFNSLEYFGIQNYFNVSQYFKSNNTILDLVANGFYKHELIHYIFSEYKLKKFLNEGVATLLSGGKGRFESRPSTEWEAITKGIKADEKYREVFDNPDSLFDGKYSHEMYYTSAILLYKYYLKLGDKLFFKQLFEVLVPLSNKDALVFVTKELNITKLSTYLEEIDSNTWVSIKSDFDKF